MNNSSWKQHNQLPDELVGTDLNPVLEQHGAIHMKTDEGLKVICFGGLISDSDNDRHPQHLLILSIT